MISPNAVLLIAGSRDFPDLEAVKRFVESLPLTVIVISGNARGVDKTAQAAALRRGMKVEVYPAIWTAKGSFNPAAGLERNSQMVERATVVVAFHDGKSRGTLDTIKKASAVKKLYKVIKSWEGDPT